MGRSKDLKLTAVAAAAPCVQGCEREGRFYYRLRVGNDQRDRRQRDWRYCGEPGPVHLPHGRRGMHNVQCRRHVHHHGSEPRRDQRHDRGMAGVEHISLE